MSKTTLQIKDRELLKAINIASATADMKQYLLVEKLLSYALKNLKKVLTK